MKNIKLLKPQPSPKTGREPLSNITNCFHSRPKSEKETHRSPSYSPVSSSRLIHYEKDSKRVLTPKAPMEAKYMHNALRCINHKEKQGKFKIESDYNACYYCQSCAVELNQKGKKLVVVKGEDLSSKMINQARQYLKSLQEVMAKLHNKRSQMRLERYKLDSRYAGITEDIEQQRRSIITKINNQYDAEINKVLQLKNKEMFKIQEQDQRLKKFEADFNTIREDVSGNINQINIHIELAQFREIMNIYWDKMVKINEKFAKSEYNSVLDSTQIFANKYLPSTDHVQRQTFDENIRKLKPSTPTGQQFTFSKNFNTKCKQAYSWQQSNQNSDSVESIVQQRIKVK